MNRSLIGMGSKSEMKIQPAENIIKKYLNDAYMLCPISAESMVNEQPFGIHEALRGCFNRLINSQYGYPFCQAYIAVENFIEESGDKFFDYALCGLYIPDKKVFYYKQSEGVEFDTQSVIETIDKPGGFKLHTVGKTMMQKGLVKNHADPHLCLVGKSRKSIIEETLELLILEHFHHGC